MQFTFRANPWQRAVCSRAINLALCFAALLAAPSVCAFDLDDLYTVEVQLDPTDSSSRDNAYETAMSRILVRMTGSTSAAESEELAGIFSNPSRYVLRYRPGRDNTLAITFDGPAIENLLRRSGHATWGPDRPVTLVWLAVDWGQGDREIIAAQDDNQRRASSRSIDRNRLLRERVLEVAAQRGVPVLFPLLDAEDLSNLSFSDIWAGFDDRLLDASSRYDVSSVLVGRVRTVGLGRNRWSYYFGDELLSWSGEPEEVVNLLADSLAQQLAFSPNARLETIRLRVAGIESVSAYGAVQRALDELNLVEEFVVHSVAGTAVDYRVKAYGGVERLGKALELTGVLERDRMAIDPLQRMLPLAESDLEFVYRP